MSSVKELEKNKVEIEFEVQEDAIREAELRAKVAIMYPASARDMLPKLLLRNSMAMAFFLRRLCRLAFRRHLMLL